MEKFVYRWFLPFLLAFITVLLFYLIFKSNVCVVGGKGMNPTLFKGQTIILSNVSEIKKNDILLIENPVHKNIPALSRVVAFPGDTVKIDQKRLFVNGELQQSDYCQFDRKIFFFSEDEFKAAVNRYKIILPRGDISGISVSVAVPPQLFNKIKSENIIKHISDDVLPDDMTDKYLFPYSSFLAWNKDFYGPLVVPKRGMKIKITVKNYVLYRLLLEKYENAGMEYRDGDIYCDGKIVNFYTFKNDYYFLLNDYRDDVSDSRTFGPVPEKVMKGIYWKTFPDFFLGN